VRREADGLPHPLGHLVADRAVVVGLRLADDDHALAPAPALDAERDHVAGPDAVDRGDRALDVFGKDVATADDDHVLDAAADDELAVDLVREIAGPQPAAVAERGRGGSRVLEVAGRHRCPPDLELADLTRAHRATAFRVAHPDLEAGHRATEPGEPASGLGPRVGRRRVPIRLEHAPFDRVYHHPGPRLGERSRDGDLSHPERAEDGAGVEPEPGAGRAERLDRARIDWLG